ncbi:hypothetical protein V1520DRAFT_341951 [Lipomyces starkeyi]|uniref:Histone transcription regulator 3 homolog n=1 Tax=Lipomyces starkeyi NRRL Y-11557 TaxID=675824 RepID=A0A1E3PZ92_LIPST|nr:hypothetical protein LIPSTDRAFT_74912 [Lipomyces starkeyi NRRL Y-11557]
MSMEKVAAPSFTALNVEEDDLSENEERIREVQIEEAFKLFQQALRAQYDQKWELASQTYNELFKVDIFTTELTGNIPPTVYGLKYLSYKNHGQLVLDWIKLSHHALSVSELHDRLAQGMAEFAEAMINESSDVEFWLKIASFMPALNLKRLTRFALECVINGNDKTVRVDDCVESDISLGIEDLSALYVLQKILIELGDDMSLARPIFKKLEGVKFSETIQRFIEKHTETPIWLQPLIQEDVSLAEALANDKPQSVNLVVNTRTWASVGKALLQLSTKTAPTEATSDPIVVTIALPEEATDAPVTQLESPDKRFPEPEDETTKGGDDQESSSRRRKRRSFADENVGERSSRRVRARVEEQNTATTEAISDHEFFESIDTLLGPYGLTFGDLVAITKSEASSETERHDTSLKDFTKILQNWKDSNAKVLLHGEGIQNPAAGASRLLDLAIVKGTPKDKPSFSDDDGLTELAESVNMGNLYLKEASIAFIKNLLLPKEDGTANFLQYVWPVSLTKVVKRLIAFYYDLVRQVIADAMKREDDRERSRYTTMSQSCFELLLDDFVDYFQQHATSDNFQATIEEFKSRLASWRVFQLDVLSLMGSGDEPDVLRLKLRFEWVSIILEKASGATHETIFLFFENFKRLLASISEKVVIELPNTLYVPEISADGVVMQMSKLHAATMFSGIFEGSSENSEKKIQILETVLKHTPTVAKALHLDLDVVERFIENSSLEFRLYLWRVLSEAYEQINDSAKSFDCLLISLKMVIDDLTVDSYGMMDFGRRTSTLFKCLFLARELLSKSVEYALGDEKLVESLDDEETSQALTSLVFLLKLLHVYVIHEDATINNNSMSLETSMYTRSAMKFREMLVQCWCLVYICFRKKLSHAVGDNEKKEKLLHMLYLLHEELGTREYCALSGGIFLKLLQRELLKFASPKTENELLQCIHCRFGLALGNESFFPYDHKANPILFDKQNALELVEFIMSMALRKRQYQGLPRSDMKTVLDKFCEVIGVPRRDNTAIYYNQSVIDKYLSQGLSPLLLQKSLKGLESLSTVRMQSDYARVAVIGLYFLQGQIYLTQYRSRKRTMAGRTEDLDYAIRYFKHDLVCNTNRLESWYGLAQTYDAQTEDDMTWSAEKLNSDYKKTIAATQRKAILCYSLATSLYLRHDAIDPPDSILATFWTDFGFELYASTRPPIDMEAYRIDEFERHFSGSMGMYTKPSHSETRSSTALKMALNMFQIAINKNSKEWRNYYMEGKCLGKLKVEPKQVLVVYLQAVQNIPEKTSSGDPILEPHYKFLSTIYKCFQRGDLDLDTSMDYLKRSHFYKDPEISVDDAKDFYRLLVDVLSRLRAADKKHWHHRPTYRIATIFDQGLHDIRRAKEELASFYALKAAKSFMSIWRPEYERAGRHFVYAFKYTMYYIDLLEKTNDLESLNLMAKKLRRLTTVMIRHTDAWEHLCKAIVQVLRNISGIPEKYLETSMTAIPVDEFFNRAAKLEFVCLHLKPAPPLIKYLQDASELRKLNVGLAPTAGMEEIFGSIYMKLYQELPELEQGLKESQVTGKDAVSEDLGSSSDEAKGSPVPISTPLESERDNSVPSERRSTAHLPGTGVFAIGGGQTDHAPSTGRPRTARVTRKELISKANALLKPLVVSEVSTPVE